MVNPENKNTQNLHIKPLADLQLLLEKQVTLAQNGNIQEVEKLTQQTEKLIDQMLRSQILELPESKSILEDVARSYNKLILIIQAQKSRTEKQILDVNKGKKTIQAYNSSTYT